MWALRFRAVERLRTNMWLVPLLCAALAVVLERELVQHDIQQQVIVFSEGTAGQFLGSVIQGMISLLGLFFAFLVLILQSATSDLSPRALAIWYRDRSLKLTLGLMTATTAYAFLLLARVRHGFVPNLALAGCAVLVLLSILAFLAFLTHVLREIRPSAVAAGLAARCRRAIERIYPAPYRPSNAPEPPVGPGIRVTYSGPGRVVQGIDVRGLLQDACQCSGILVLKIGVGDFIRSGTLLARVLGARCAPDEKHLLRRLALGTERALEQDPVFAIRVLAEVASRSPGSNDATTAVQMLDREEELLAELSQRNLDVGILRDEACRPRVFVPAPSWDDYLELALREVRHYGRDAPMVLERMEKLLDALWASAPPERRPAIEKQRLLLEEVTGVHREVEVAPEHAPSVH